MSEKILFVDDEPNILSALQRQLHGKYDVYTAESGARGLELLKTAGPFSVIVADMRMPGMSGLEFLQQAKLVSKASILMMLTGNADQQTAIDAVEKGQVFHFLNKPCPPDRLIQALEAGLQLYNLQEQIGQIKSFISKAS